MKNGGGRNGAGPFAGRGRGFISDKIENIPILGRLSPYLRKLGLGICDRKKTNQWQTYRYEMWPRS